MASPLGSTPGIIVGVGVGTAASVALEPAIELPRQNAWRRNANRILDAATLARLVAQGGVELDVAHLEAKRDGFDTDKVDALVYLAQTVPGFAQALAAWRRNAGEHVDRGDFGGLWQHALEKEGLDARYKPYLSDLFWERLSPQDLAYAVIRGLVPDAGLLPVAPPTTGDKVPRFPVADLDVLAEAQAHGFDRERFRVLVGRSGLSLAPTMAANALFREIIGLRDYQLAIAEGDLRNEWRDAILEVSRQILTAGEYAELQLRGFLTLDERRQLTGQHGMTHADSDRLYDVLGRSIPVHQVTTGLARGGRFGGTGAGIPAEYLQTLQRGNLRPEYYGLAYANRYSYPGAFFFRTLLQSGELTAAEGEQVFLELGWSPHWAKRIAEALAPAAGPTVDKHVAKAQVQLWTALHKSYLDHHTGAAEATRLLERAGVTAAAAPTVLELWSLERQLVRRELTAKQLAKAVGDGVTNPDTGAPWTRDEAIAALVALGYDQGDAEVILDEG